MNGMRKSVWPISANIRLTSQMYQKCSETITILDDRFDYKEERFVTFGLLQGRVVSVVHTEDDEVIRIISVRKATKNEQKFYFQNVGY